MPSQSSMQNRPDSKKRGIYIAVIVLVLLLAYDLSPFGGNIRFYSKWAECGQKPVATLGSGFMNAGVQHYIEPKSVSLNRPSIEYFCTPLEAEKAGYSASADRSYFPNLNPR